MTTAAKTDLALQVGMPQADDHERFVLGWLIDGESNEAFNQAAGAVSAADFGLQKHQIIFRAMKELDGRGIRIDRVHVAEFLASKSMLESVGNVSGIVALTDGIPRIPDIGGYLRVIKEKSVLRGTIAVAQKIMNDCLLQNGDSSEIISRGTALLSGLSADADSARRWVTPGMVISEAVGGLNEFLCPTAGIGGIPMPWVSLQERLCGFQKGELIILAGRPSSGKSAAGLQMCHYAAIKGFEPALVSLEVKRDAITKRLLSQVSMVDSHKMRSGYMSTDDRQRIFDAANKISPLPFWIDDKRNQTTESIRQSLKRRAQEGNIDLIVIDHFHLVAGAAREETRDRYARAADAFQNLAGEFDCPCLVLAQLNRKCEEENRVPGLPDLKETGKLEENADVVLFVHRPETYAKNRDREELRGTAQFIVAKQRSGPTGQQNMVWLAATQLFAEMAHEGEGGFVES